MRLLRIFKLVKTSASLSMLLESIAHTIVNLGTFSILLFLLIYVFTLWGMNFFAGKYNFNNDTSVALTK